MCLKEEILDGYVKTVGRIDLEGEVRNSVLDILSLRCLLGSRDESALHICVSFAVLHTGSSLPSF